MSGQIIKQPSLSVKKYEFTHKHADSQLYILVQMYTILTNHDIWTIHSMQRQCSCSESSMYIITNSTYDERKAWGISMRSSPLWFTVNMRDIGMPTSRYAQTSWQHVTYPACLCLSLNSDFSNCKPLVNCGWQVRYELVYKTNSIDTRKLTAIKITHTIKNVMHH